MPKQPAAAPDDEDLLTPEEVATWLRVPLSTLNGWRARRRRDGSRQGPQWVLIEKRVMYLRKHVREYLAEREGQYATGGFASPSAWTNR